MDDTNFDAKFGTIPPYVLSQSLPFERKAVVMAIQFVVCLFILLIIRPPFVTEVGKRDAIDPSASVIVALFTVLSSWVVCMTGMNPADTFKRSCEFLYRISKT